MVKFTPCFPDDEIVATVSRELTWSHIVLLLSLKSTQARDHYARAAAAERWSVRELRRQIDRKGFERNAIADSHALAA